jgi:hypothetical protein
MSRDDDDDAATGLVQVQCTCITMSEKAIQIRISNGSQYWIPQSQIHVDSEVWKKDQTGKLVIPAWLAKEKRIASEDYVES